MYTQDEYGLNLSDFALFLVAMKNKTVHRNILSIIMDEPELELSEVHVEEVILNRSGKRAIRLDAWAVDTKQVRYNTEMQNDTQKDDVRKRSRFYQSLLDSPLLKSGKETRYKQLPSTVIIFITQEDIFGKDLAMYTFTEQCQEIQGLYLEDGTKKIFLNMTSRKGRPELVSLLQYMKDSRLDNPDNQVKDARIIQVDEIVDEIKQTEEWEAVRMSIYSMGVEQGWTESILELLRDLGEVGPGLCERIQGERDQKVLKDWLRLAAHARSVKEFEEKM